MDDSATSHGLSPAPRGRWRAFVLPMTVLLIVLTPLAWPFRPLNWQERKLVGTWRADVPYGWARQYTFSPDRQVDVRDVFLDGDHLMEVPASMVARQQASWTCSGSALNCDWKHATFPKTRWGRMKLSVNAWSKQQIFTPIETAAVAFPDADHMTMGKKTFVRVDGPDSPPGPRRKD